MMSVQMTILIARSLDIYQLVPLLHKEATFVHIQMSVATCIWVLTSTLTEESVHIGQRLAELGSTICV